MAKAAKADIPVGKAIIVDGWVIGHPDESTYTAFSTVCPHASGTINAIEYQGGRAIAVCPLHKSHFDVATGNVVSGPARDGLRAASEVKLNGDSVEVTD